MVGREAPKVFDYIDVAWLKERLQNGDWKKNNNVYGARMPVDIIHF
jgi:hypothetical protein